MSDASCQYTSNADMNEKIIKEVMSFVLSEKVKTVRCMMPKVA